MWKPIILLAELTFIFFTLSEANHCQCPKNEIYEQCLSCPDRNCGVNIAAVACAPTPTPGDPGCNPGCQCRDGYLRNRNGTCIPENQCPNHRKCPKNEIYEQCLSCPARNCGVNIAAVSCLPSPNPGEPDCNPGCRCRDGYLRNGNGICIPENQCPTCPQNEVYDICPATCPPQRCGVDETLILCAPSPSPGDANCGPGCRCEYGLVRNDEGVCVNKDECPPTCGKNEVYSNCSNRGCGPFYCFDLGFPTGCVKIDQKYCKPGCICKEGYVRDDNDICIRNSRCPSCGGDPNAVSGCGTNCGRLCSNYDKGNISCTAICNRNACDCRKGYVYDEKTEKCVLPDNCSSNKCKKSHQVYDPCLQVCPPGTCQSIGKLYFCPRSRTGAECKGGCRCKKGYYKNSIGECITEENCLKCNGPNEYWSCGGACDNVCSTLSQQNQTNCPIVNVKCNPMCYCEKGYARNASNICIPIKECPENQCGVNERYEECPATLCPPKSCLELGFPKTCPNATDPCPGPPGCVCINGYVRNKRGKCIPKQNCPSCGGDSNAVAGCGVCQKRCSETGPRPCPRICLINACNCKEGFVLDDDTGKCIPPEQCPLKCPENEVYSACTQEGCTAKTCTQLGQPVPCIKIDPKYCIKGCICKEGWLRNENGECVPEDQCNQCNTLNEYYDSCAPTCPPQTCESIGKVYDCPITAQVCRGACRCKEGYFRNKIGDCISQENCLKCTGPNEYWSCGSACDNVCATLTQQNQTNCPVFNVKCNPKCYCESGYARNVNNTCIPIDQCPPPTCPANERLEECPGAMCTPRSCSQLGFPIPCELTLADGSNSCPGPAECVCDNDLVRDDDGNCVPKQECPSCGGDPNAVAGCGVNCGRRCSTYKIKNPICPLICGLNGCDCKKGYVYDNNLKKCVLPINCTPTCGINEEWSQCSNGGCNKQKCSQIGEPQICVDPLTCVGGCVCQDSYLRSENGTCIPAAQCPESNCPRQNEHYACSFDCPPDTCDSIGQIYSCPAQVQCNPSCVCDKGYYRNAIGTCISEEDCLKCNGPHEYYSCGGACDNVCATLSEQNQTNCPIVNIKCNEMCYCEEGYAREDNNTCIPIDQCPSPCGLNERYDSCPDLACQPETCAEVGFPINCPGLSEGGYHGKPGCICDYNMMRDEDGNCVPTSQCSSCGGDPNAVPGCGINCGRLCSNYDKGNVACPAICYENACDCKEQYVFDENTNKCVLPANCTAVCGTNEIYVSCSNGIGGCRRRDCSDLGLPILYIDPIECSGGCICQEGTLRDDKGNCVPESECPTNSSGENEVYNSCANGYCGWRDCKDIGGPEYCVDPVECTGLCICQKGSLRNDDGICVPQEQCPVKCGPNENFRCGGACDNVCDSLQTQNQTNCPIKNKRCNLKCFCNRGYARDDNGVCIPIQQCGEKCGCDPNAMPGCGVNCGRHCYNYNREPTFCPEICNLDGCDCKDTYFYDDNIGKCVLPTDCTPLCGNNEVYNDCVNGVGDRNSCADLSLPSVYVEARTCEKGCLCVEGYLRDENGTCVPEDRCPTSCNRDLNAVSGCGINCGRRCSNYNEKDVACIQVCYENACDCKEDYVYDDNTGKCVLPSQCTCSDNNSGLTVTLSPSDPVYPDLPVNKTDAQARLNKAGIVLTGNFMHQLVSSKPGESFVASATSVLIPLAQLALFASQLVLQQLLQLLNLKSKNEIRAIFPDLVKNYEIQTKVEFDVATKYYANINYPLSEDFKNESLTYFNATGENVDFSKNQKAADTINAWVELQTRGKIQNLITPDSLSADTRMVLCNAIYFLGDWLKQFNEKDTETKDFYKSDGSIVQLPIMYQENTFNYAENDTGFQALLMDYNNSNFTFLCILPREKDGLLNTIDIFRNGDVLPNVIASMSQEKVKVSLPKMTIDTSMDIGDMLKKANITEMFNPNSDGFKGLLQNDEPLYVSAAVQKAHISVYEKGTEAAAATGVTVTTLSLPQNPPPVYVFNADHPFIFFIRFLDTVLFFGTFVK